MAVFIEITLKRASKIFHEHETVEGLVCIDCPELRHDGITLTMEGIVNLQLSPKNVGLFDAFYRTVKPVQLVYSTVDIAHAGKIPAGKTEIPFEIPLEARAGKSLYETYHGVFINVEYHLKCALKRRLLAKDVERKVEFFVEYKTEIPRNVKGKKPGTDLFPVKFTISPESIHNAQSISLGIPKFKITGTLHTSICNIAKPLTGELIVENAELPIKSVELQLVRVETCGCAEGFARDATEIQNIQIGDGNVPYDLAIPIYMIFPKLFTCPTLKTTNFKIEFEVNVVIIFEDDHLITENFPVTLVR